MNYSNIWICPITGEVLKNGMKKKNLLGVEHVYEGDYGLMLEKGAEIFLIPVKCWELWSWEFVEKVRRLVFEKK